MAVVVVVISASFSLAVSSFCLVRLISSILLRRFRVCNTVIQVDKCVRILRNYSTPLLSGFYLMMSNERDETREGHYTTKGSPSFFFFFDHGRPSPHQSKNDDYRELEQ